MADENKVPTVWVRGAGDDHKVALWERDEAHPNGEAFVVNEDKMVEVGETAMVKRLIAEGKLTKGDKAVSATVVTEPKPESVNLRRKE